MKLFNKPIMRQFRFVLYCLLALALLLALLCYRAIDNLAMKNAQAYAANTAEKFNAEVEFLFERIDALSNSLLFDEAIEKMLHSPYSSRTPEYLAALKSQFTSYSLMNRDLSEIALCSPSMAWSSFFDGETLNQFRRELQGTYGTHCFGLYTSSLTVQRKDTTRRLVFGHNVYGMHDQKLYGQYLGCILLSIDPSKSPITLPTGNGTSTYFLLVDQKNTAFPFNCTQQECAEILAQMKKTMEQTQPEADHLETPDFLVYTKQIPQTGLYMLSVVNRHELNRNVIQTTGILVGVTLLAFLLILWLMHLILRSIVRPLRKLSQHIALVTVSPLSQDLPPLTLEGCEELVKVTQSFNALREKQVRLNRELQQATVSLYETQLGLKQAELDYLRSQINPHFLYNTLETIQALALERNAPDIGDAAAALGKLLRHNVKGAPIIPLSDELEITRAYLTIQKLRFPDRLTILESVRDNVRSLPVPKLLLQPLVENAICHGIEPKMEPGTIYIGARLEKERLLISVYDDGVGIAPETLAQLQEALDGPLSGRDSAMAHVGLLNVHRRIRLAYGEGYGSTLASTPGEGTQVNLHLPILHQEERPQ